MVSLTACFSLFFLNNHFFGVRSCVGLFPCHLLVPTIKMVVWGLRTRLHGHKTWQKNLLILVLLHKNSLNIPIWDPCSNLIPESQSLFDLLIQFLQLFYIIFSEGRGWTFFTIFVFRQYSSKFKLIGSASNVDRGLFNWLFFLN